MFVFHSHFSLIIVCLPVPVWYIVSVECNLLLLFLFLLASLARLLSHPCINWQINSRLDSTTTCLTITWLFFPAFLHLVSINVYLLHGNIFLCAERKMHMRTNYQLTEYNAIYGKNAFSIFNFLRQRFFSSRFLLFAMCINFHFSTRFKI